MDVRIHQIYYVDEQRALLDPAFIPYDNTANERPEWREYHVFRREFFRGACRDDAITGFVSWKFGAKTKTKGEGFKRFIHNNPGHDVYFLNPPRLMREEFANVWLQGEHHHPGLIEITEAVLRLAGHKMSLATLEQPADATLYCNYWAGTSAFWERYINFCEPIYQVIEHAIDSKLRCRIDSRADKVINACFRPFIMERLFTTLIALNSSIRWAALTPAHSLWARVRSWSRPSRYSTLR